MVFSADGKLGPRCGMILSESALDVETALDLGIGPRSGTNPRSESYINTINSLSRRRLSRITADIEEKI